MYLLNPLTALAVMPAIPDLHSTMFLLNRGNSACPVIVINIYIPLCIY